jgi:hypothetical protein
VFSSRGIVKDKRRRIDQVQSAEFVADLPALSVDELRRRRHICSDLDTEYSYHRRLLQGRLDLLAFEMRRRSGEEKRSLLEALPEVLAGPPAAPSGRSARRVRVEVPDAPVLGRRSEDGALLDEFLTRLPDLDDDELLAIRARLVEAEAGVSRQRRAVFEASDRIEEELVRRFGLLDAGGAEAAPQG